MNNGSRTADAATLLRRMLLAELGRDIPENEIISLVKRRWCALSTLAHSIHEECGWQNAMAEGIARAHTARA